MGVSQLRSGWGVTHGDHDRVPGGGEDVSVIVALVVLGELLGEEFSGELRHREGWAAETQCIAPGFLLMKFP